MAVIDRFETVDIDTEEDFELAKVVAQYLKEKGV